MNPAKYLSLLSLGLFVAAPVLAEPVEVSASEINGNTYVFELPYADLVSGEKWQKAFADSFNVSVMKEDDGTTYITPNTGVQEAEINLALDFKKAGYQVTKVEVRDSANYFADSDVKSDVEIEASLSSDGKTFVPLWSKQCGAESRPEPPDTSTTDFSGVDTIYYKVAFKVLENDSSGGFRYVAAQWNRLDPNSDPDRHFRIEVTLEKKP